MCKLKLVRKELSVESTRASFARKCVSASMSSVNLFLLSSFFISSALCICYFVIFPACVVSHAPSYSRTLSPRERTNAHDKKESSGLFSSPLTTLSFLLSPLIYMLLVYKDILFVLSLLSPLSLLSLHFAAVVSADATRHSEM